MYCSHHSNTVALYRCYRCNTTLCEECVEHKAKSGIEIVTCRDCGGLVEELIYPYADEFYTEPISIIFYPIGFKRLIYFIITAAVIIFALKFIPQNLSTKAFNAPFGAIAAILLWLFLSFVWMVDIAHKSLPTKGIGSIVSRWVKAIFSFIFAGFYVYAIIYALFYILGAKKLSVIQAYNVVYSSINSPATIAILILATMFLSFLFLLYAIPSCGQIKITKSVNIMFHIKLIKKHLPQILWLTAYLTIIQSIAIALVPLAVSFYSNQEISIAFAANVIGIQYMLSVFGVFAGWFVYSIRHEIFDYEYVEDALMPDMAGYRISRSHRDKTDENTPKQSIVWLERKLAITPDDAELMAELILAYENAGRINDAEKLGSRLIATYIKNQRLAAAAEIYEKFYAHNNKYTLAPFIMVKLGDFYEQQKRWNASCLVYRNLAMYHNDSPLAGQALYKCAYILSYRLNKHDAAISALRKLLRDFPDNPVRGQAEELLARLEINDRGSI